ncbi:hypothetical protein E7744_00720 [Citricoccus sp. SGAir0253]|uniref:hypothetical protein n=1 Tax=Citricoccus sp. SGAir0253 TaxID=2567881 RepID=UPI0010CCF349|nr:hypothetical protein [Citricoccus sp. SGAir0253]QCU76917.1 hypothetical protein E7744_00720 [Citricoccus sp. SGAir0253]
MTESPRTNNLSRPAPGPLPATARVGVVRWYLVGIACLVITLWLALAVFGIPASFFSDPSPMLGFLRVVAVPGVLLAGYAAWYYLNGALRPQHVTVDERGVTTPAWTLAWEEILNAEVAPAPWVEPHKQQLAFHVTDEAFARVRSANRGHSGRPFGMGGLVANRPIVRTQYGTWPMASELLPVVEAQLEATPYPGRRPRWPQ